MANKKLYFGVEEKRYETGERLYDVAIWNEFGTEIVPPRPAFRMGSERAVKSNQKMIKAQITNIAKAGLVKNSKLSKQLIDRMQTVLLTQLGRSGIKQIKEIIAKKETAHNAPATIKKKGFDHPLLETGLLSDNISYLVE